MFMKLPDLPKIRKSDEADITPIVMRWFEENYTENSYVVEVKIKGGRLKDHQPSALKQVDDGFFDMKLKDHGSRNPFDFFGLRGADAFIVVCDGKECIAYSYDKIEQFRFTLSRLN